MIDKLYIFTNTNCLYFFSVSGDLLHNSSHDDNITIFDCRIRIADFLINPADAFGLCRMNLCLLFDDESCDPGKLADLDTNITSFCNFVIGSLHKYVVCRLNNL